MAARRDPTLAVYMLVMVATASAAALAPLLPSLRRDLHLSGLETASIVTVTTGALLLVSMPIGVMADRFGAQRLVKAAALLSIVGLLGAGIADGYLVLLASATLFGIAYGIIWTAGPAMLVSGPAAAKAMGRTIAFSGIGLLVGPVTAGLLVDIGGRRAAFFALAALSLVPLVMLARAREVETPEPAAKPLARLRQLSFSDRDLVAALATVGVLGAASGVTTLAVPLALSADGYSELAIGAIFSASAVLWIGMAWIAGQVDPRHIAPRVVGGGLMILGFAWALPVASVGAVAVACCILLSAGFRAPLNSFTYILGRNSATAVASGTGAIVGLINLTWGLAAVTTPLAVGVLLGLGQTRVPFALVSVPALAAGIVLLRCKRGSPSTGVPVETATA